MYDIIVIGAGPAGLTAAIYGRRASKSVLVIEAKNYGGAIVNTLDIQNYPCEMNISGFDFATKMYEQATNLGAKVIFEKVLEINNNDNQKEVITNKNKYISKTVIIATGSENRKLDVKNESELVGKGISYCATCDGAFYKNKVVAVVGGGNTAVEDALYLSDICKKVYIILRNDVFKADESSVKLLKERDNIEIIINSKVKELVSDDKLNGIILCDKNNNETKLDVDGLFIAIGRIPQNDIFSDLVKLDKFGYIISDEECNTNIKGIYVSGDNRVKNIRQLVTATSDGAIAAMSAIKYINNNRK